MKYEVKQKRTNTTEGDGLSPEEHEVIAVLHARNHAVSFEMVVHRFR